MPSILCVRLLRGRGPLGSFFFMQWVRTMCGAVGCGVGCGGVVVVVFVEVWCVHAREGEEEGG